MKNKPSSANENINAQPHKAIITFDELDPMTQQTIIEEHFETKMRTGRSLNYSFKLLIEHYGEGFLSRARYYRLWDKFVQCPDDATKDGRSKNGGCPKALTGTKKDAYEIARSRKCAHNTTWSAALRFLDEVGKPLGIPKADHPTVSQCRYYWSKEDADTRIAIDPDPLSAFNRAMAYTNRVQIAPDDEHQVDEGQETIFSFNKKKKVVIYFTRHIDVASGVSRTTHYSFDPFTERDTMIGLKKALLSDKSIGHPYNCMPKVIKLDRATWHKTNNIQRVNYLLRNREGRTSRIQLNPPRQPRANSCVERAVGLTKQVFFPDVHGRFRTWLKTQRIEKPLMNQALAYAEDVGHEISRFLAWDNQQKKRGNAHTRLENYRAGAPEESLKTKDADIEKLFIYYRQMKFTGNGVEVDGVKYDTEGLNRYRGRKMWVGVAPEHNKDNPADEIYLAEEDKDTIFKILATVPRIGLKTSCLKQRVWKKNYRSGRKTVEEYAERSNELEKKFPHTKNLDATTERSRVVPKPARRQKKSKVIKDKQKAQPDRPKRTKLGVCTTKTK